MPPHAFLSPCPNSKKMDHHSVKGPSHAAFLGSKSAVNWEMLPSTTVFAILPVGVAAALFSAEISPSVAQRSIHSPTKYNLGPTKYNLPKTIRKATLCEEPSRDCKWIRRDNTTAVEISTPRYQRNRSRPYFSPHDPNEEDALAGH